MGGTKFVLQISFFVLYLNFSETAPVDFERVQLIPITRYRPSLQPTVIKLQIGDIIDNSGIFPIVIDVPDTISTIFNGISTIVTAVGQRIPIVQGFFRPEQPRNPSNITIKKPIVRDEYLYYFSVNNEVMGDKKMLLVPILQQKITIVDLREKTMEHNKAKV